MNVEAKLARLGLEVPDLEDLYRTNPSGAHYISHFAVQNLLHLSGTTPRKGGQPHLPGVVGKDLTVAQGYEAARYAALTTLAAVKYALGDLDRVQQIVHMIGFVNSTPGFSDQASAPSVVSFRLDSPLIRGLSCPVADPNRTLFIRAVSWGVRSEVR
jgi:hypothetical protein